MAPSDPAEHINRLGIGQPTGERVRNDFEQGVGSKIFVVVEVRFHKNTTESVNDLLVALVKCELYVCFSELNLFPACRGSRMKEGGIRLRGELMLLCGDSHLVYKLRITIGEEAILRQAVVPLQLPEIVQRTSLDFFGTVIKFLSVAKGEMRLLLALDLGKSVIVYQKAYYT